MEVESLLLVEAHGLGIDGEVAVELAKIVEPVVQSFEAFEDWGVYYFSSTRCATACEKLDEESRNDGAVLLWHVAQQARSLLKGCVGVDYFNLRRKELENGPSSSTLQ